MSNFKREAIFYFKMNNGDDIVGEVVWTEEDQLYQKKYMVQDPMKIEYRDVNGQQAVSLNRYFSFTDLHAIELKEKDIMTIQSLSDSFTDYYINSVKFNYLYVDKVTHLGIEDVNKMMSTAVSIENQEFVAAMKQYNIDPDSFLDQLPN